MTTEEAIDILNNTAWLGSDNGIRVYPAVKMAMEALKNQSKYKSLLQDLHDYQGSICCYCKHFNHNNCEHFGDLPKEDGIPLSCGKFKWRGEEDA